MSPPTTVLVFGDQLNRRIGALAAATPRDHSILLVEGEQLLRPTRHRQRLHFVVASMRRFAAELETAGFQVDLRRAQTMQSGLEGHVLEHRPAAVIATEPNSRTGRRWCERHGVGTVASNQFLCHERAFAAWAEGRRQLRMEDFYRWHRSRLGYLLDDDGEPVSGRWNLDAENRQPPPSDPSRFPAPARDQLDALDRAVLDSLPASPGADPDGTWATSRAGALARLDHFVELALVDFGPYEDAMSSASWHLAHSLLSPYLNLGLLMPDEVCDAIVTAHRSGRIPLQSAEGMIRQVIGWREYVWGLYWLWPDHAESNVLGHRRQLPPAFTGDATTSMACVAAALDGLDRRAWVHHIQRLMVLSNLANLYGSRPRLVATWMGDRYIDGAEWVMVPNVMGMALWADGGRMATKPYVSGGAYINRMSDYCRDCRFRPTRRTGDDACPFTTLYWDFLTRHRATLSRSNRMAQALRNAERLADLDEVSAHAEQVRRAIREGRC